MFTVRNKHVIVVGSGIAGLTAAIKCSENIEVVTILEKNNFIGGNSLKATSGINAAETIHQKNQNIADSIGNFFNDTIRFGGRRDLIHILTNKSSDAIEWLEGIGKAVREQPSFLLSKLSKCGGHSFARTHRRGDCGEANPPPIGWNIVDILKKYIKLFCPNISIITEAQVIQLLSNEHSSVIGVLYKSPHQSSSSSLYGTAVILCTGGFSHDWSSSDSLLLKYSVQSPQIKPFLSSPLPLPFLPTTNGKFATGDGIKMALKLNANLLDMEQIQLHPTGFIDPSNPGNFEKFLAPEALRGHGCLLISPITGERFVNELETRDVVSNAIFKNCTIHDIMSDYNPYKEFHKTFAYGLMFESTVENFGKSPIDFYISKGFIKKTNFSTLSNELKNPKLSNGLRITLQNMHHDPETIQFYWFAVTPVIHYTMGGLEINENGQVINKFGNVIKNLYAAGEVSSGIHGRNRIAGNSLLECVVFGKIVGINAALE